jgi:hypothetical protein
MEAIEMAQMALSFRDEDKTQANANHQAPESRENQDQLNNNNNNNNPSTPENKLTQFLEASAEKSRQTLQRVLAMQQHQQRGRTGRGSMEEKDKTASSSMSSEESCDHPMTVAIYWAKEVSIAVIIFCVHLSKQFECLIKNVEGRGEYLSCSRHSTPFLLLLLILILFKYVNGYRLSLFVRLLVLVPSYALTWTSCRPQPYLSPVRDLLTRKAPQVGLRD